MTACNNAAITSSLRSSFDSVVRPSVRPSVQVLVNPRFHRIAFNRTLQCRVCFFCSEPNCPPLFMLVAARLFDCPLLPLSLWLPNPLPPPFLFLLLHASDRPIAQCGPRPNPAVTRSRARGRRVSPSLPSSLPRSSQKLPIAPYLASD